ncbi:nucleoside-diphosphate sugar epimerase/dehydratase [Sphingosinicella sp. BN140058]|uniref:polysaccharide biosynthesis protein n=1 Tax=Sphingosinicella sp. BN140058 TaxID=1892855 RepID=UPI001011932B|nr:nucleoside-diphosphate sugar epimerase/dehydratase [Sphingosinicella sp. BN140058]QAY78040.1 polysaccharide biosynthesis protein [Sphingosinicella sp. BN140058]
MAKESGFGPATTPAPRPASERAPRAAGPTRAGGLLPRSGAGLLRLFAVAGLDAAAVTLTLLLAVARVDGDAPRAVPASPGALALFAVLAVTAFFLFGLYQRSWRYLSSEDCIFLGAVVVSGLALPWAIRLYLSPSTFNDTSLLLPSILVHVILLTGVMGAMRICRRTIRERWRARATRQAVALQRRRVLLVGELDWARAIIELARADATCTFEVVGILTETPNVGRLRIGGVKVLGATDRLRPVVGDLAARGSRPEAIIVHEDSERSQAALARLLPAANDLELTIGRIRNLWGGPGGDAGSHLQLEQLPLAELLGRAMVELDKGPVERTLAGQRILVTGAGGTIGGELVRQIAGFRPAEIVLLDHCEYNLYAIDMEVREKFPEVTFHSELCSIRQMPALRKVFDRHRPQLVFHAAALKHVPIVEASPCDGVHTNVLGTRNVANAVCEFGARAMVQVSTDKAVNPVGMMGATKRLGELYCQALDLIGSADLDSPRFMTVRFGNVLGSSGSLIPLFKKQIAQGKPLTVTHPDMERFFMTVEEAVQLVLQSSTRTMELQGSRGAIFVLDMGSPVKIMDVAKRMLRLAGRPLDDDAIRVVGLRPGEKLYEELFDASEERVPSQIPGVFEARPCPLPLDRLVLGFSQLEQHIKEGDVEALRALTLALIEAPKHAAWDPALLRIIQESKMYPPSEQDLTGGPGTQPAIPLKRYPGRKA